MGRGIEMDVEFKNDDLDRLETDSGFSGGFPEGVVKSFRRRMQAIRAAKDERDLYAVRGNRFEKLLGKRSHQYSIRLNDQFRLILELKPASDRNVLVIVNIEDYH